MALITPELPYDYPHFRYWKFFIHHIVISWSSIFLVVTGIWYYTNLCMLAFIVFIILLGIYKMFKQN